MHESVQAYGKPALYSDLTMRNSYLFIITFTSLALHGGCTQEAEPIRGAYPYSQKEAINNGLTP